MRKASDDSSWFIFNFASVTTCSSLCSQTINRSVALIALNSVFSPVRSRSHTISHSLSRRPNVFPTRGNHNWNRSPRQPNVRSKYRKFQCNRVGFLFSPESRIKVGSVGIVIDQRPKQIRMCSLQHFICVIGKLSEWNENGANKFHFHCACHAIHCPCGVRCLLVILILSQFF